MLIDFAAAHAQYLIGTSDGGKWVFTPANPRNPLAGKHLASSQVFSNNALGVAVYLRNEIDDAGSAVAVFTGLKLSFSNKINGRYALNNDPDRVSITLDIGAVRHLYTWLQGVISTFRQEVVRSGAPPKTISGFRTSGGPFTHTLRIYTTAPTGQINKIDVGLGYGDLFTLSMFCVGYARLLYPSIEGVLIDKLLVIPQEFDAPGSPDTGPVKFPHAGTFEQDDSASSQRQVDPSQRTEPCTVQPEQSRPPIEMRDDAPVTPDLMRVQKAIFAVGINKWPRRSRPAIEYIQANATLEVMDRLIKAGNRGDFHEWDRIASICDA